MKACLDWLLEDDAPGVQLRARLDLLGESPRSRRIAALRARCNDYPPVARMLAKVGAAIAAGDYQKYRGACWTLLFLAELEADARDECVQRLARHVLSRQLENGGFSPNGAPRLEIVCLTANCLRALVRLGFGGDERVVRGYRRLAERILPSGGVPCRVVDEYCFQSSCQMTLPQTLRALAAAPAGVPPRELGRLRDVLVERLLANRVHRYVRPDLPEFRALAARRPKDVSFHDFKASYLRSHPVPAAEMRPKPGWLRFGFPRSYNPDLLDGLLALAELGGRHGPAADAALGEALDHVEAKRTRDGRWKLEDSLNGKTWAQIEHKGRPSKWITLRALTVLEHFGRVEV